MESSVLDMKGLYDTRVVFEVFRVKSCLSLKYKLKFPVSDDDLRFLIEYFQEPIVSYDSLTKLAKIISRGLK